MKTLAVLLTIGVLALGCQGSTGADATDGADVTTDAAIDARLDAATEAAADAVTDALPDDVDAPPPVPITAPECVADPTCPYPILNAHRGLCGDEPENTIAAFLQCEQHVVPMFEIDLRQTADGAVVLMHDGTVDRTTDGETRFPGRTEVGQLTLAEFLTLVTDDPRCQADPDATPDRCHPTTFAALLARTRPDSVLFLDFKDGEPEATAADILAADAAERVIFFDSDFARLRAYRAAVPGGLVMPRAQAVEDFAAFVAPENDDLALRWIHGDPYHATPEVAALLKAHGVRLYFNVFTLSDVPFAVATYTPDTAKKQTYLDKAHAALDKAMADGGSGFGTEFAPLGAEYLYPNGFGVAR